jgi:hypothetical protein
LLKGPVLRILLFAYDPVWCSKPPAGGWPYLPTAWADGWDDDHSVHCIAPTLRPRWAATSPLGSFPGETSKWSATFRVGPSSSPPPSPARRRSALRRPTAISPAGFDEVAAELGRTLDFAKVPKHEKAEVLAACAAYKDESRRATSRPTRAAEATVLPSQTIPSRPSRGRSPSRLAMASTWATVPAYLAVIELIFRKPTRRPYRGRLKWLSELNEEYAAACTQGKSRWSRLPLHEPDTGNN